MAGSIIYKLKRQTGILRRMSIKTRLLIAFLITSLLPVLLVAFYSNYRYEISITDKLSAYSLQVLSESAINASRELQQYETLSESIIINDAVQEGLASFSEMQDYEHNLAITRVNDALGEQVFRLSNLSNVVILTAEGTPFYDLGYELYPNDQILNSLRGISRDQGNMK